MSLCSWVNVVVGRMTAIDRAAKHVVVSQEDIVLYDHLILCTGQQYQVRPAGRSGCARHVCALWVRSAPSAPQLPLRIHEGALQSPRTGPGLCPKPSRKPIPRKALGSGMKMTAGRGNVTLGAVVQKPGSCCSAEQHPGSPRVRRWRLTSAREVGVWRR